MKKLILTVIAFTSLAYVSFAERSAPGTPGAITVESDPAFAAFRSTAQGSIEATRLFLATQTASVSDGNPRAYFMIIATGPGLGGDAIGTNNNPFTIAITSAGEARRTICVLPGTYTLTALLEVPSNITFHWMEGAVISQSGNINVISTSGTFTGILTLKPLASWSAGYFLRVNGGAYVQDVFIKDGSVASLAISVATVLVQLAGDRPRIDSLRLIGNTMSGAAAGNNGIVGIMESSGALINSAYIRDTSAKGMSIFQSGRTTGAAINNLTIIADVVDQLLYPRGVGASPAPSSSYGLSINNWYVQWRGVGDASGIIGFDACNFCSYTNMTFIDVGPAAAADNIFQGMTASVSTANVISNVTIFGASTAFVLDSGQRNTFIHGNNGQNVTTVFSQTLDQATKRRDNYFNGTMQTDD